MFIPLRSPASRRGSDGGFMVGDLFSMIPEKQKILIVDDSEMNRAILTGILDDGYDLSGGGKRDASP